MRLKFRTHSISYTLEHIIALIVVRKLFGYIPLNKNAKIIVNQILTGDSVDFIS